MTPERLDNDRYEIGRRLGHGGMATVYLAEDTKLGRQVAIKVLADNLAHDDDFRERFMREARLAAQLDHPNVVQVFDVSSDEDRPFIVMEHVAGGTLGDLIERRGRRTDPEERLGMLIQGCRGLGHAHERKLVHRDVKPHNLLIREADGCVKVADFGIARAVEDTRLTKTGGVIGTERYMAPEQLEGRAVSPATDVYSFGVVASEVLGSERAPLVGAVVDRCLSENPRSRYRDANELCEALTAVEAGGDTTVPITSRPPARRSTAVTAAIPAPTGAFEPTAVRRRRGARGGGRALIGLALAAGIVAGVLLVTSSFGGGDGGGGGNSTTFLEPPIQSGPAPQLDDPAEQAPALSKWIRENSE